MIKLYRGNMIILVTTLFMVIFTMWVMVDTSELIQSKEEKIKTVGYQAARRPSNLTGDSERQDIVKWAKAQKDYAESSSAPITVFHKYYGKSTEAWCQMYVNWCSEMAKMPSTGFYRESFACASSYKAYKSLGGVDRTTTSSTGLRAGWLVYERFGSASGEPNHVGLYTGSSWMHGNYNNGHVREIEKNYGNFIAYAKPYYRSKVYFNTNKKGASMKGYVYPKEYSAWYTEEKECNLSTKGLACPGYTFEGWYTDSSCVNKKMKTTTSDYGVIRVYAKWKQANGVVPTIEETPSQNIDNSGKTAYNLNTSNLGSKKDNVKKTVSTMITEVKKEMIE